MPLRTPHPLQLNEVGQHVNTPGWLQALAAIGMLILTGVMAYAIPPLAGRPPAMSAPVTVSSQPTSPPVSQMKPADPMPSGTSLSRREEAHVARSHRATTQPVEYNVASNGAIISNGQAGGQTATVINNQTVVGPVTSIGQTGGVIAGVVITSGASPSQ